MGCLLRKSTLTRGLLAKAVNSIGGLLIIGYANLRNNLRYVIIYLLIEYK